MARISLLRAALVGLLVIPASRPAFAQPLADPNYLEFTASADHHATSNGAPVLSRYDLLLYPAGSGSPARTVNLGKPVPDAAGTIRLSLRSLLDPLPAAGSLYEVRVAAVGPAGSAASALSNPFSFGSAPCSYAVSPSSRSVNAAATTSTFTVTAATGCAWTAVSGAGWIAVTRGASGSGNGTVTFSVAANQTAATRTATMTIAGQPRAVSQGGTGCTYTVAPLAHSVRRAGGTVFVSVNAPSGCTWTASEGSSWLTIAAGAAGSGNGTVSVSVAPYTGASSRAATASVAGRTVSFSQSAIPRPPSGFRVVPR